MGRTAASIVCLALLALAVPAAAEYTVTLTNGSSFTTLYQPEEAGWDPSVVMVITNVGNWIGIPRDEIEQISSSDDDRGFGKRLSITTLSFGFLANDAPTTGPEQAAQQAPFQQQRSYDLQQFVEPGEAGGGGVPVYGVQFSGSGGGIGGGGVSQRPAPAAPSGGGSGGAEQ